LVTFGTPVVVDFVVVVVFLGPEAQRGISSGWDRDKTTGGGGDGVVLLVVAVVVSLACRKAAGM